MNRPFFPSLNLEILMLDAPLAVNRLLLAQNGPFLQSFGGKWYLSTPPNRSQRNGSPR